jgi:PKD repeat protein
MAVTVDALGSQEALAGVSEITVDAGASGGSGLQYLVAFGDGATASQPVARHVYDAPGRYTIALTVTDASRRTASASHTVVVASPAGAWIAAAYLSRPRIVDVRTLVLEAHGTEARGSLTRDGAAETAVAGTLSSDRRIRLAVAGTGETLEGIVPSVVSGEQTAWPLAVRGGAADGETLTFSRRPAGPSGAAPDASMGIRFFSFSAPFAIKQISPVQFDASRSRGEGLRYFIEFGDGEVSTEPVATHPVERAGQYVSRLTVVDRFGRVDSEPSPFEARSLVTAGYYVWWESSHGQVIIDTQDRTAIAGRFSRHATMTAERQSLTFTGRADASGEVAITLNETGERLSGTLRLAWTTYWENELALTYTNGSLQGNRVVYRFRNGY